MTVNVLDCKYPGAVCWGKNYQHNSARDCKNATNGSAPGYRLIEQKAARQ